MRIDVHEGKPRIMVRVAVVEGQERIRFSSDGPFTIEDDCHSRKSQGEPGQIWEVRVKGGAPARVSYMVRTDLLTDEEQAHRRLKERQRLGVPACLLTAGQKLEHKGRTLLDSREYWICVGEYESESEVMNKAQTSSVDHAIAVRQMTGVPRGHVEVLDPEGMVLCLGRRIMAQPDGDGQVILHDVPVGRGFHWEHRERLSFRGGLEFLLGNDGQLLVVNELPLEDYLVSVNSSEMDARSPMEFLKAQTVAARSTVLATAGKHHRQEPFDLCNADHCQCYYGIVRERPQSRQAARETSGEVLMFEEQICDARYSKVCGGIMEANEHVWRGKPISYMRSGVDAESIEAARGFYPIDSEQKARRWIEATPEVYCNPDVADLPDYMAYALKYFRWKISYGRRELEEIIQNKTGWEVGTLKRLEPRSRGASGRISSLAIIGDKNTFILSSELEIRRALSRSHLYSSCFVVDYERDAAGEIEKVVLRGAGWGHGVGLCQVGAAMMAVRGKKHDEILAHYYPGAGLKKLLQM